MQIIYFLPGLYVCVSGGKKCLFFGNFSVLCFLETSVLRFTLLPYYQRYEPHHLRSSINLAMHKIKPGTLTAGTVKSNFKGTIERSVARDNAFSFMSSVKGTPAYWHVFI